MSDPASEPVMIIWRCHCGLSVVTFPAYILLLITGTEGQDFHAWLSPGIISLLYTFMHLVDHRVSEYSVLNKISSVRPGNYCGDRSIGLEFGVFFFLANFSPF